MQKEFTKSYSILMLLVFSVLLLVERFATPFASYSLITCGIGIIALCLYFYFAELSMEKIGITVKKKEILTPILHGILLPIVSILVVMGIEQLIWIATGHSGLYFTIGRDFYFSNIQNSSMAYVSLPGFMKWSLAGVGISLVRSVFYEMGFRGYFYYDVGEHYSYSGANFYQALAYTVMAGLPSLVMLVHAGMKGTMFNAPVWVLPAMIIVTIANLLLMGMRQGNLRTLTGSVWICVICYFVFDYFNTIFHNVSVYPEYLSNFVVLIRALVVQIVATLLNIPAKKLYYKRMKKEMNQTQTRDVDIDRIAASVLFEDQRRQERQYMQ